jgi:predicted nucleic-acid-binding protein
MQVAAILEDIARTEVFTVEDRSEAWAEQNAYRASHADFADCLIGRGNQALRAPSAASLQTARQVGRFR